MNLAEEFTLVAYADDGTPVTDGTRLDHGLGGAVLLDLVLAGRIDVENGQVVVRDPAPTGDAQPDRALALIAADPKTRKPGHWVSKFAGTARKEALAALVEQEVLTVEKDKVLWVFPRTRYPATNGREPAAETDARARMRWAILDDRPVEPRTAALCALVGATGLEREVFPDLDRKQVDRRLKAIAEGSWAADAVRSTIEQVQAAVMVAVMAATTTTTITSN